MLSLKSRLYRFALKRQMRRRPGVASLAERRLALEASTSRFKMPPQVAVQPLEVAGCRAEWLRPQGARQDAAILFLHGGAYIAGSLNTHRSMAAHIAQSCNLPLLLPEYRLAPEHPYPAAIEDAQAIYAWLLGTQDLATQRLVVMGDSAGGGLALALVLRLREAGQRLPGALVCLSPWTDLQLTGESLRTRLDKDPFFPDLQALHGCARLYGGQADLGHPEISPVRASLQGFPPLYVQVGDHEILLSDAQRLVQNAQRAGVQARLEVWPGMWHVWQIAGPSLPEGRQALARIAAFVRQVLG